MFAGYFETISVKTKIALLTVFMSVMLIATAGLGMFGLAKSNASLRTVYLDRVIPLDQIAEIMDLANAMITDSNSFAKQDNQALLNYVENIEQTHSKIDKLWSAYLTTYLTPEEVKLADEVARLQSDFYTNGIKQVIAYYKNNDPSTALEFLDKTVNAKFVAYMEKADALKALQVRVAKEEFNLATERYTTMRMITLCALFTTILLAVGFSAWFYRIVIRQLGIEPLYAMKLAKDIANGRVDRELFVNQGDTSSMLFHLKTMQDAINRFICAQTEMAKKHQEGWISERLDESQFPGAFGNMAKEINELLSAHISVKMQVVAIITEYAKGNFALDMERLPGEKAKIVSAIDGVKSSLLNLSNQIKLLAEAGVRGDFSQRADSSQFSYMFKEMLDNFNKLMATCDTSFNDIQAVSRTLAQGDLTKNIDRDYPGTFGEVKEAINLTVGNLKVLVADIHQASETINTAAKEIAAGNHDLSHRTETQAASLEETAASMHQLTATVQQNAENAKQANDLAAGASTIAGQGVTIIEQVVHTMEEINQSSHCIVDIISVIDDIAFQTNILALNAAVEAARAGDQGKGFAVVAIEVRNLAQRAAGAAGEIKKLIGDSVDRITGGSKQVAQAGHTMEEIVAAIQKVTHIMNQIAAASLEQSSGIAQVNQAIVQMDESTQQNAALVEEAAASAESLEEQTQELAKTVANFKLDGNYNYQAAHKTRSKPTPANHSEKHKTQVLGKLESVVDMNTAWEEF